MTLEEVVTILDDLGGTESNTPEYKACHIAISMVNTIIEIFRNYNDANHPVTPKDMEDFCMIHESNVIPIGKENLNKIIWYDKGVIYK